MHSIWGGSELSNPNGCWDWVGWYGANADQIGGEFRLRKLAEILLLTFQGVQMVAIVNQVAQIMSGNTGGGTSSGGGSTTTLKTTTKPTTTTTASGSSGTGAPLYGQCGGYGWTGPTTCAQGVCTAYSTEYAQCLLPV
jgi:hypothetical protein